MLKRVLSIAVVFIAACGSEARQGPATGSSNPSLPPHTIPLTRALLAGTSELKVALSIARLIPTQITVSTDEGAEAVACTADTDCGAFQGAYCSAGYCVTNVTTTSLFYAANMPVAEAKIPVPCDGSLYSVMVFESPKTVAPFDITAVSVSDAFTMGKDCNYTPFNWHPAPQPAYTVPQIYVGLAAPYDKYTVTPTGLGDPWANNWSLTANNAASTAPWATFTAPAAPGDITFDGKFYLNHALVTGETATDWVLTVTTIVTPIATQVVPLP